MHIYMYIWTYLLSGSFDTKVYIWVYIWKYLACNLEPRFLFLHIYLWGWAEMKFLCRYTNSKMCSLTSYIIYMRERMYATAYVVRSLIFLSL